MWGDDWCCYLLNQTCATHKHVDKTSLYPNAGSPDVWTGCSEAVMASVKPVPCQHIFTRWCLRCSLESKNLLRYGGICCWSITHLVNLIELWLFSAALALFTPLLTRLNYSSSQRPPAHIYRPLQQREAGRYTLHSNSHLLCSSTPRSISLLFGCRLTHFPRLLISSLLSSRPV